MPNEHFSEKKSELFLRYISTFLCEKKSFFIKKHFNCNFQKKIFETITKIKKKIDNFFKKQILVENYS